MSETTSRMSETTSRTAPKPVVKDVERYKTVLCEKWKATGSCPYTWKCQFAHGCEELRNRSKGGRPKNAATENVGSVGNREHKAIGTTAKPRRTQENWRRSPVESQQASTPASKPALENIKPLAADGFFGDLSAADAPLAAQISFEVPGCYECDDMPEGLEDRPPVSPVGAPSPAGSSVADRSQATPVGTPSPSMQAVAGPPTDVTSTPAVHPVAAKLPPIMHFLDLQKPSLKPQPSGGASLVPLALNHTTGKVLSTQSSFNTLLIRRQMSNLLDELSLREPSTKQLVVNWAV